MESIFLLLHKRPDTNDVKVIGIYSSLELAEAALERTRILPGFLKHPDAFTLDMYPIDKDHWPRGFVHL
jgi:hypothetical protein